MVSREIWEKHALMNFSKTHKLHSSFGQILLPRLISFSANTARSASIAKNVFLLNFAY